MAHIQIDEKILSNVCNEDLIDVIQGLIHDELQKPEADIDTDFIEACVNTMLEIEQDEDNSFVPLVPLVKRTDFIDRITGNQHRGISITKKARVAIVAAAIAASTISANAALEAVTGVNIIEEVSNLVQSRLVSLGFIEDMDMDDALEEMDKNENEPDKPTTTQPTTVETTTAPHTEPESTTNINQETTTTKPDDNNDTTTTTTENTTEPIASKPTTTNKYIPPTTENNLTEIYRHADKVVMTGLKAEFDSSFKSDYIYGESLSYDGMHLTAVYSDNSQKSVSLDDCSCTYGIDMYKTANHILTISYNNATVRVEITVRPDEDTRGSIICSNDDYDYLLTDRGAYITRYKGSDKYITLNEVDGNKVIAISGSVFENSDIESITAEHLLKLFDNAFKNCKTLNTITAPQVEYIGDSVFEGCSLLETSIVSPSLKHIGEKVYKDTAIKELVIPSGIDEIPLSLCENCSELVTATLPSGVTTINKFAFCECTKLESVTGTADIKSVGDFAFYNDTLVDFDTSVPLLETAGEYAFAYCNTIDFNTLSSNIKAIGQYAFAYCFNLKEVEIPSDIKVISEGTFRGAHISRLTLNEGLEVIDDCAFMSTEIVSLNLPNSLKRIGSYGLYSIKLKEVHFGADIEYIGSSAFYKRKNLMFYLYDNTVPLEYAKANSISYTLKEKED